MGNVKGQVNHLYVSMDVRMYRLRFKCENHQPADSIENHGNAVASSGKMKRGAIS